MEELEHLNRVLNVQRCINRIVVGESSRANLLQEVCDVLTRSGGYNNAWISEGTTVESLRLTVHSGLGDVSQALSDRFGDNAPECCIRAISSNELFVSDLFTDECGACPLLGGRFIEEATLAVRLHHKDRIYGVLASAIPKAFLPLEDEKEIFLEIAEKISATLYMFDMKEEQHLTEETAAGSDSFAGITESKEAECVLFESEELFGKMTSTSQDSIIMMDHNMRIYFFNSSAEKMFGYGIDEVLGKDMHALLAPDAYRDAYTKGLETFRKTGTGMFLGRTIELEGKRKDGVEFPLELAISAFQIGDEWNAVGIIRDMTDRKRTELDLLDAREEAVKASNEKSMLLTDMSLEVRTPLNSIIGMADRLRESGLSDEQMKYIEVLRSASDDLLTLINSVPGISEVEEVESGSTVREKTPQDTERPQFDTRGLTILVVDPNPMNRLLLRETLTGWGASVEESTSGEEALEILTNARSRNEPFQLVILDCSLPGMNGFDVAGEISADPGHTETLIIMLSSGRKGDEVLCEKYDVKGCLIKPVNRAELRKAVSNVMGSG
jgi:PAS domain S-box-containing protein